MRDFDLGILFFYFEDRRKREVHDDLEFTVLSF